MLIPLYEGDYLARKAARSPSGKVPVLLDRAVGVTVWESLAIAEHCAERFPDAGLWPADPAARAVARAVTSEMHGGFGALRSQRPMNLRADRAGLPSTPELEADIARVLALWSDCRARFGEGGAGPFLFGAWCVADAFYAPVTFRFTSYHVPLDETARAYVEAVQAHPPVARWAEAGRAESWSIPQYDL